MANKKVELDVSGSSLILSGDIDQNETTEIDSASSNRSMHWSIKNNIEILQFRIKGKTSDNPFNVPIPKTFNTDLTIKVKKNEVMLWQYSIEWIDKNGYIQEKDPKISINPVR